MTFTGNSISIYFSDTHISVYQQYISGIQFIWRNKYFDFLKLFEQNKQLIKA